MSEKRRDNKNRILRTGESQRPNGQYEYKYKDITGQRKSVYSWRLVATDRNPQGKRSKFSLRELEDKIKQDVEDGLRTDLSNIKVKELADLYFADLNVKRSTQANYRSKIDRSILPFLGDVPVKNVTEIHVRRFYKYLIEENCYKENTVKIIAAVLSSIFHYAERLKIIKENPTKGVLNEFRKSFVKTEPRRALTKEQQKALLESTGRSEKNLLYKHMIIAFLDTGCRVSELTGLQWSDIDFDNNCITIRHGLQYQKQYNTKHYGFYMDTTKNGKERTVPMSARLRKVLLYKAMLNKADKSDKPNVDGYNDFVFLNRQGKLFSTFTVDYMLKKFAKSAGIDMPLSAHILRHTFCTRLCEVETNIKVLQELMGHSDIQTTMRIYAEAQDDAKQKAVEKYNILVEEEAI